MKITGYNPFVKLDAHVRETSENDKNDKNKINTSSNEASKMDHVVLSPLARDILGAKKILASVPDVMEDKVAEIKARIENGTYTVDGKKIAHKMLKESIIDSLV